MWKKKYKKINDNKKSAIKPYLNDINNLQKTDTQKIQSTIAINFVSSKDIDEEHVLHSKSHNIEIMIRDEADEVIKEIFKSLLSRYQIGLETSIKGGDFIFDCVNLLHYKCHLINLECGVSLIDFTDWIKSKKATINHINDDDENF